MTKLRLQKQPRHDTLEILREFLYEAEITLPNSAPPPHMLKRPPDTLLDYLIQVAKCVRKDVENQNRHILERIPIDLIITHPGVGIMHISLLSVSQLELTTTYRNGILGLRMRLSGPQPKLSGLQCQIIPIGFGHIASSPSQRLVLSTPGRLSGTSWST